MIPAQLAIPSGIEMMVVLLIIVLLFGADKIPKLARASGKALGEFKRGREQLEEGLGGEDGDTESEE